MSNNTNWKRLVEKTQASTFVLPAGWTSRDDMAEQLECSTDRVRVLMAPALKTQVVETKVFPVWDSVTKKVLRVTAYREVPKKTP